MPKNTLKTYKVYFQETISWEFNIQAENNEEAYNKGLQMQTWENYDVEQNEFNVTELTEGDIT